MILQILFRQLFPTSTFLLLIVLTALAVLLLIQQTRGEHPFFISHWAWRLYRDHPLDLCTFLARVSTLEVALSKERNEQL